MWKGFFNWCVKQIEQKAKTLKEIKESKRPTTKVNIPTYSWWQKMRGARLPLFETEEWKNRKKE